MIFDQTLSCEGHNMASAVSKQPLEWPSNGGRVNKPARAERREQMSDEVAAHLRGAIMSGTLLPGTFIRLDETAAQLGVSITPVREALRTLRGEGMVLVVGDGDKVALRSVTIDERIGDLYIVTAGLKRGERVIVEGLQKVRPGMQVKPELKPATAAPAAPASPPAAKPKAGG